MGEKFQPEEAVLSSEQRKKKALEMIKATNRGDEALGQPVNESGTIEENSNIRIGEDGTIYRGEQPESSEEK